MRLHLGILILATAASAAWAQMPILNNTRNQLKSATEKNLPRNAMKNTSTTGTAPAAVNSTTHPSKGAVVAHSNVAKAHSAAGHKQAKKSATATAKSSAPAATPAPGGVAEKRDENDGADLPASMSDVAKKLAVARRDPFVSPVVAHIENTTCTTGKRCLTPAQMSLKGVVRSENGMIAVVVNSMNKAYFLRENDPIFNGYVLRITGDSIVLKENFQDNLGHPRTREVVKRISTPAV